MKYYRHQSQVWAFNIDGSQDQFIPDGAVFMTPDEVDAHLNPPPPPPAIPQMVSAFQAKAALLNAGLLDDVKELMAAPGTPAIAKLAWSEAVEFRRDSPTIAAMQGELGLTDAQVDDLFIVAYGIRA